MENLLIVDDDKGIQKQIKWSLADYHCLFADNRQQAINMVRLHEPKVVLLDMGLPPDASNASEGLLALQEIISLMPLCKVIVITGNDDRQVPIEAITRGAYDYFQKPVDNELINVIVSRAFYLANIEAEKNEISRLAGGSNNMIGSSEAMESLRSVIARIAPTQISALILGESGTGKEVAARAIHQQSDRAGKNFVAINCASIPENLLESELFGFEKGAFTGAHKTTKGKIELAQKGTLFLDEIGDMPMLLQAKLLRFLQERVIERVGGRQEIDVDVRVVCATNQNLATLVSEKVFREDLYYRISEIELKLKPLRERELDVVLLAQFFLLQNAREYNTKVKGFSDNAIDALKGYQWPGNIRELQNKVKSAVIMAQTSLVSEYDLGLAVPDATGLQLNLRTVRERAESKAIKQAHILAKGNMSKTAELLGITRPTLYGLVDKYDLQLPELVSEKCQI
ncbi:PEP-CTERM-box response regulator transcription factor [Thalassotalea maritima]|uniref:PEP-CTERM-box response regulator transcription factor n=1 Tax=Thalassotalea maritima TaxID=3242416 RepID=UPI003529030C